MQAHREQYSTKHMPVTLATDGDAPLAGAAAWPKSPDQHLARSSQCGHPPLQKPQLLRASPLGLQGEAASPLGCSTAAPHCLACAKEGRLIAASHHLGAGETQKSALVHQKSALELEMHQMLMSSEAVLEGGARPRTSMYTACTRHVHGMCTACTRHVHGMCTAT